MTKGKAPLAQRLAKAVERLAMAARTVVEAEERQPSPEVVAAIAAAIAAALGPQPFRIRSVRPVYVRPWAVAGRFESTLRRSRWDP